MFLLNLFQVHEELEQAKLNENKLSVALKEKKDELTNVTQTLDDTRTELKNKVG